MGGKLRTMPFVKRLFSPILSLFPVLAINAYYFGFDTNIILYKNSVLNVFLYVASLYIILNARWVKDRRICRISLYTAMLLALMLTLGHLVSKTNSMAILFTSMGTLFERLVMFVGFFVLFHSVLKLGFGAMHRREIISPLNSRWQCFGKTNGSLFILWAILFLCWLPCFFAYYPGILSYDSRNQLLQLFGDIDISRHHPALHTWFLGLCLELGSLFGGANAQMAAHSILQMAIVSFPCALTVWYMGKREVHFGLRLMALAFFAFNPLNAIFALLATKDVLFTAMWNLFTIMLLGIVANPRRFFSSALRQAAFALSILFYCLLKNNTLYVFVLSAICFLFIFKKFFKNILVLCSVTLACYFLINGPLFTALGVKDGSIKDSFSVPLQQIANIAVHHDQELSQEEKEAIGEILDYPVIREEYNPRFADPVKHTFQEENFASDPQKYIALWGKLLRKYPAGYLDAFASLNLGYWYPDTVTPDPFSQRAYIETDMRGIAKHFQPSRQSVFPRLLEFYEAFARGRFMQKIPFLSLLFSIGLPVWVLIIGIMSCFAKRLSRLAVVFLPTLILWVGHLAGPVSNLRYIYTIMIAYPLYGIIMAQPKAFVSVNNIHSID